MCGLLKIFVELTLFSSFILKITNFENLDNYTFDLFIYTITIFKNAKESFYFCDVGDIFDKYERWCEVFPRIKPFYAVKCNPDPLVLKLMISMGMGFDCASKVYCYFSMYKQLISLPKKADLVLHISIQVFFQVISIKLN